MRARLKHLSRPCLSRTPYREDHLPFGSKRPPPFVVAQFPSTPSPSPITETVPNALPSYQLKLARQETSPTSTRLSTTSTRHTCSLPFISLRSDMSAQPIQVLPHAPMPARIRLSPMSSSLYVSAESWPILKGFLTSSSQTLLERAGDSSLSPTPRDQHHHPDEGNTVSASSPATSNKLGTYTKKIYVVLFDHSPSSFAVSANSSSPSASKTDVQGRERRLAINGPDDVLTLGLSFYPIRQDLPGSSTLSETASVLVGFDVGSSSIDLGEVMKRLGESQVRSRPAV